MLLIAGLIFTDRIKIGGLYQRMEPGEGLRAGFICSVMGRTAASTPPNPKENKNKPQTQQRAPRPTNYPVIKPPSRRSLE